MYSLECIPYKLSYNTEGRFWGVYLEQNIKINFVNIRHHLGVKIFNVATTIIVFVKLYKYKQFVGAE
jgi:hypothetical protein